MISHPGLFNVLRYVKRDTEKRVSELCNCPQYYCTLCNVLDNCDVPGDRVYSNGEFIEKKKQCELCRCYYGNILCQETKCPPLPEGCKPQKVEGFCCPQLLCGKYIQYTIWISSNFYFSNIKNFIKI